MHTQMKRDERRRHVRLSYRTLCAPSGFHLISLPLILLLFILNYDDASRYGRMSKGFRYVLMQSEGMFWVLAFPAVYLYNSNM